MRRARRSRASSAPPTSSPSAVMKGVARIKELTKGVGADSVLECVGTQESMMQAIRATRPGGDVGLRRRPARRRARRRAALLSLTCACTAVRRRCADTCHDLIDLVLEGPIDPGKVFDLTLPSTRWRRAIARWTSAARSRRCCARNAWAQPNHGTRPLGIPPDLLEACQAVNASLERDGVCGMTHNMIPLPNLVVKTRWVRGGRRRSGRGGAGRRTSPS